MIPVWPADLPPRPLADGFREGLEDGRLRTPMEAGLPKSRLRSSVAMRPVEASFRVTADQKARLERFYREEVGRGTLPFLLPDPVAQDRFLLADTETVLTDEVDRPLIVEAWLLVVFGDSPPTFAPRQRGLSFAASLSLSVLPL